MSKVVTRHPINTACPFGLVESITTYQGGTGWLARVKFDGQVFAANVRLTPTQCAELAARCPSVDSYTTFHRCLNVLLVGFGYPAITAADVPHLVIGWARYMKAVAV